MPTRGESHRYLPALDGVRAFAVASVIVFHVGFAHAGGGFLGVDIFFVLSGFLITGLLLGEREKTGGIRLPAFWGRRARRLLPALLTMLVVLAAYTWAGGPGMNPQTVRPDAVATLFYFANWHFIVDQQPYFSQFMAASPLVHTWSLAIEEQFYLIWPLAMVAMLHVGRRGRHAKGDDTALDSRRRLALLVTLVLVAASAASMALQFHGAATDYRVYYGTDTRAFELLVGAALALFMAPRPVLPERARGALHLAGILSFLGLVYWVVAASAQSSNQAWMYQGGFLGAVLLAAVVIADVSQPNPGPLGALLSIRPVRWVGKISYGLYLWHWPVIQITNQANTGLSGLALQATQIGITFGIATVSYYVIEVPLRRATYSSWRKWVVAPVGVVSTAGIILAGTVPVAEASSVSLVSPEAVSRSGTSALSARAQTLPSDPPLSSASLGTAATQPPITLPAGRVVSRSNPLRVDVIGDSVMYDAEPGVAAALQGTGSVKVVNDSFPGWGLTAPGWRNGFSDMIKRDHPDLVVGTWSWDFGAAEADPVGYSDLMNQALQTLLAPGSGVSGVAILEFPKSGSRGSQFDATERIASAKQQEASRETWNAVENGLVPLWPGRLMFLPVAPSLEVNGHYSVWLPGSGGNWVRARKTDNTHICPLGAADYGAAVLADLTPVFRLPPPQSGWPTASWTNDPRYNDPPGSCPADQPPPGYVSSLSPHASSTSQFN